MMDRLREKFGPNHTYRAGDECHLSVDGLLDFHDEGSNQSGKLVYIDGEKNKFHRWFV